MSDLRAEISRILDDWPEHNRLDEHERVLEEIMAAIEAGRSGH